MSDSVTDFMREIEDAFRLATNLPNRSAYKIYYGRIHKAPILTLGINPGGGPTHTSADGTMQKSGALASASSSYFENAEHDVLDCDWKENFGLRKLLMPLVGHDTKRFRHEVVKTNLAFRRSAKKTDIDMDSAIAESAPFLQRIIDHVQPNLIVLTGVKMDAFTRSFAETTQTLGESQRDTGVKQVVFVASRVRIWNCKHDTIVAQVAHASQFSWTYEKYDVSRRMLQLLN